MYIIAELLRRQRKKRKMKKEPSSYLYLQQHCETRQKTHNFFVSFIILSIVQQYKKKKFIRDVSNL